MATYDNTAFQIAHQGGNNAYETRKAYQEQMRKNRSRETLGNILRNYSNPNVNYGYNQAMTDVFRTLGPEEGQRVAASLQAAEKQAADMKRQSDYATALKNMGVDPALAADPAMARQIQEQNNLDQIIGRFSGPSPNVGINPQLIDQNGEPEDNIRTQPQPQDDIQLRGTSGDLSNFPISELNKLLIHPKTRPMAQAELRRREKEQDRGIQQTEQSFKDTKDYRQQVADSAKFAQKSIQNKSKQLKLIQKGNINDPVTVWLAEKLPGAVGNKLLSDDTQVYRSGLFDEFGVLREMFKGATRTKEIDLLEDKLATLDKSDLAKKRIQEIGIEKAKADIIKRNAAARVEKENPDLPLLQFQERVDEYAQPELDKLYNKIMDQYNEVFFEYAPPQVTFVGDNGVEYKNVSKKELKDFLKQAEDAGIIMRVQE